MMDFFDKLVTAGFCWGFALMLAAATVENERLMKWAFAFFALATIIWILT